MTGNHLPQAFFKKIDQLATVIRLTIYYIVFWLTVSVRNGNSWIANPAMIWCLYPYTNDQDFWYWLRKVCLHKGYNWCVRNNQLFIYEKRFRGDSGSARPPIRNSYSLEYFGKELEQMNLLLEGKYPGSNAHVSGIRVERRVAYDLYNQQAFGLDQLIAAKETQGRILLTDIRMGKHSSTLYLSGRPLYWEGWACVFENHPHQWEIGRTAPDELGMMGPKPEPSY